MRFKAIVLAAVAFAAISLGCPARASAQQFSFKVKQERLLGDRRGELIISTTGIEFKTSSEKPELRWTYGDIKLLELLSPTKLRLWTYQDHSFPPGKDVVYTFKVEGSVLNSEVRDFLRKRIARPLVSEVAEETGRPVTEIPVKHLHRFGGCQGVLKVYKDFLVFDAIHGPDSRSWRWSDIQSISKLGRYRLEVLTYEPQHGGPSRSYNFELKEPVSERTYDFLWDQVLRPELPSKAGAGVGGTSK